MRVAPKWLAVLSGVVLASCSSSGSSNPTTYTVGGTVSGLAGTGLVLRNNGGDDLAIAGNGSFTFATAVASGGAYSVTVATQPSSPAQTCSVANGSGTVSGANVTGVVVTCATGTRAVGGTVTGLQGTGLVLQDNAGDDLPVSANGAFTFPTPVAVGATYAVTVRTQPSSPTQSCTVTNGAGTIGAANVTNVAVDCVTSSFTVGGSAVGVSGSGVVLQLNGSNNLLVSGSGPFGFSTPIRSGSSYAVTVQSSPAGVSCSVANGTGIIGGANVTNVTVVCASQTYTVGGTVSGLVGTGLVLRNNGGDNLSISGNGPFTFASRVASGGAYSVTVLTQPGSPAQTCSVANGTGVVSGNVTNVAVTCVTASFAVGGTVQGLATGASVVLLNNGGNALTVSANGAFSFTTPVTSGSAYAVTVQTQPASQTCAVANGTGTVTSSAVTSVAVTCVTNARTIGGTVTGLDGSGLVLQNNGADDLPITASGAFTFPTPIVQGGAYAVTIRTQPGAPAQACTVQNGSGTVGATNVTSVVVACPPMVVLQRWDAPTSWGGSSNSFWLDGEQGMVQHLVFTPAVDEWAPIVWNAPDGAPGTHALSGVGSLGATRQASGPFNLTSVAQRYVATSGDEALDVQGDLLVCAVVKPDWNPMIPGADDRIVFAKGERGVAGWALMQSSGYFSFRYQSSSGEKVAFTETEFAMPFETAIPPSYEGPLNPSYVVLCGGRDAAGGNIALVANGWNSSGVTAVPATDTMIPAIAHASVGGYETNNVLHGYGGRIYETAVWKLPATRANIEAKMAPILGLLMPGGASAATYLRDREGYYPGVGAGTPYHTAWKHQPRIDPTGKGFLFGLQAANRVQYPEALELWTRTPAGGVGTPVVTANDATPPGDADIANATRIQLPPGASISLLLNAFGNPGYLHGQVWLRAVGAQTGSLTIATAIGATAMGSQTVALGPLTAWTRVQLTELTANPTAGLNTLYLRNDGATPIDFHAWGVVLTQLGRDIAGVPDSSVRQLGFDPTPTIYSSLDTSGTREVLFFAPIRSSTAGDGFCIGAEGQPATGMTWAGPFFDRRTLVEWTGAFAAGDLPANLAKLMVLGSAGDNAIRFRVQAGGAAPVDLDAVLPASLGIDTAGRIKGCVTAAGDTTIYVDDVPVATGSLGAAAPDLAGGTLWVGSDYTGTEPWQGYVSAATACRNIAPATSCLP